HSREQLRPKPAQNLRTAGTGWERAVQDPALPRSFAGFNGRAGTRIPPRLMRAEVQYGAVAIVNVLSHMSMMDVPIDDHCVRDSVFFLRVSSCNSDVVEEAEAHAAIRGRMMARRTNSAEGIASFSPDHLVDCV